MAKLRTFLNGFTRAGSAILGTISGASQFILVCMIFTQVLMRYVFKSSALFGVEEAELLPIFWIYFIGGALTSCEGSHIECSLVGLVFKNNKAAQNICNAIMFILYLFLSFIAIKYTWSHFAYLLKVHKYSVYYHIPVIVYEGTSFVGFLIMAVFSLRDALRFLTGLLTEPVEQEA